MKIFTGNFANVKKYEARGVLPQTLGCTVVRREPFYSSSGVGKHERSLKFAS